jgi:diguanylate cyclase (GGDEF)-like protein
MRHGFASALCILLAACGAAAAVESSPQPQPLRVPDSAAPTFSVYTSRDGLSEDIWSTVGFGPDGFVWAGSAATLARFDGYRWDPPKQPPGSSLVRDMANDADGNLWAIFESEGLVRFDGKRWQQVGPARFHQRFSTIDTDGQIELWVAHNQGFAQLIEGRWVEAIRISNQQIGRLIAIARTRNLFGGPREWIASADRGLWYRDLAPAVGDWRQFEHPAAQNIAVTDLLAVTDDDRDELWVVSYGGGVLRIRDDGVRIWRGDSGELPSEAVYSAVAIHDATGDRTMWMASRAGLLRFRGERVDVFNRRHGLPSDAVRGLKVQRDGNGTDALWVATEGGLARANLSDSPWQTVSLLGANENGIFGVLLEPNGRGGERLWVGSASEGLAMLDAGEWRRFSAADGSLPAKSVRGLWRLPGDDGREHTLLSLVGAPLHEITESQTFQALPTPWPLRKDGALNRMLARTFEGKIEWWAATTHAGVFRLRDGEWQAFRTLGSDVPTAVSWLTEQIDGSGRSWLWAADPLGIARFDGQTWQRLPASLGLPADGFRALTLIADGDAQTLWASSTHHGILRLDVSDPLRPLALAKGELPPPPDPTIYSVLPDSTGRIYVCTNNGVQQLTPRTDGSYASRVFRRRDGLVHDECNTNGQLVDRFDRYWVGTLGGLSMFDPNLQPPRRSTQPKPLLFSSLQLGAEPLEIPSARPLELPANMQDLRIEYSLLSGTRESESRYRTQLVGFDAEPGAWTHERSRSFSTLPPGEYRFRVEAQDAVAVAATPIELPLSVLPLWWQRPGLQVVLAGSGLLLLIGIVLGYNRSLRVRQKKLRQQVAERTQELRDANERLTELSYLDPLTGVANRRRLLEAMRVGIARAAEQGKPLGLIVADVDHFKQYNDRFGHLAGDAALRAIAGAMDSAMREQDLVSRFGGEEFACLMVDADRATVSRVAERMRALVEALPPRSLGNDSQTLTISAGVLSCVPLATQTPEALLHAADLALYAAKSAGRNRVHAADPTLD